MSNHYFIGVRLPDHAAEKLAAERNRWNIRSHKQVIPPEDMHITLVYIGADPHNELSAVHESLQHIQIQPFEVTISGAGTFGNPETPRVVYGKVAENGPLRELQREVAETLDSFRLRPDRRPYVPHVTLAKKWSGGEPLRQPLELGTVTFSVNEFSLFKVNLGKRPRYEAVHTYRLGAGG